MKKTILSLLITAGLLSNVGPSFARDTKHLLPIAAALEAKDAQDKLDGSIKFSSATRQLRRFSASWAPMFPIASTSVRTLND